MIVLTAPGEVEDRVVGLGAGAVDYLVKPFSLAELAARVGRPRFRGHRECYARPPRATTSTARRCRSGFCVSTRTLATSSPRSLPAS